MKRRAAALGLLLAAGCAPAGFLASPDDYTSYRRTRIAPTLEARLAAADAYLARYPEGAFREPVKAYFDRAELVFYKAKQGTIPGLQDYLGALPKGPHAKEAEGRLGALLDTRDRTEASLGGAASEMTARLDRAGVERQKVREQIGAWIGRFLDASVWKAPLSQAKESLIVPWSLELPAPSCKALDPGLRDPALPAGAARRCAKLLELPYAVRVNGVNEDRQATVEIVVVQDAEGRPLQASVGGPDLFLRVEETFAIRAIDPGDTERRVASIARAADLVRGEWIRAVSADPACQRPVVAPVFLDLGCQGVRVTARAAVDPGEDDLVVMAPPAAPP